VDIQHLDLTRNRDFLGCRVPRAAFDRLEGARLGGQPLPQTLVLDLERRPRERRIWRVDGALTRVIPYPRGHQALSRALIAPREEEQCECVEVLILRGAFDHVADRQGVSRIKWLDIEAGIATDDTVMQHLSACLDYALDAAEPAMSVAIDQITTSLTVHIAQRYGGLLLTRTPQRGGLSAWQLRLVLATFDRRLEGSVSIDELARQCGLSVSHFSRAFRRSTGLAPHRWLMQRRVQVAKDLILFEAIPLAQVAVACGFADQSHFTRTFASLIGLTPARWRVDQKHQRALG